MGPGRRTRILIVDDSAVMRSLLRAVVCADAGLEVGGTAVDGESALRSLESVRPDLILLDVEMPVMDGLETLRQLRARGHKMPVIMCSSLTRRGAMVTIEALACGASDYVAKPAGQAGREEAVRALTLDLTPRIHALAGQLPPEQPAVFPVSMRKPIPPLLPAVARTQSTTAVPAVMVVGVSTGGPAALDVMLPELPRDFPLPVVIVQHMPELFTKLFAERLNHRCRLRVREAAEGDPVRPGTIYIARGNWHTEMICSAWAGQAPTLRLHQGPLENHCRPAADVLFRSAAAVYGSGVLAVVLTGMGSDGLAGSRVIRDLGGIVLAQDEPTSTVWGMPGAVANAGLAQSILPLNAIVPEVIRIANRAVGSEVGDLLRSGV